MFVSGVMCSFNTLIFSFRNAIDSHNHEPINFIDKMNSDRSESESDVVEVKEYSDIKRIRPAEL